MLAGLVLAGPLFAADAPKMPVAGGATAGIARYVGSYVWQGPGKDFGGLSGLDLADDGQTYVALSDRARLFGGRLERNAAGQVTGATLTHRGRLGWTQGKPPPPGKPGDAEGLAVLPDGGFFVSFEGPSRMAYYPDLDTAAMPQEGSRDFGGFPANEGLEALAVDRQGTIYTIPEHAMARGPAFPVYRRRDGRWDVAFVIAAAGSFVPTGADFGPDGLLYVLERDFLGVRGFASRVVRFDPAAPQTGQELLRTAPGVHDNLESIAVWRDAGGAIRLTMVSDDNYSFLQRTELVDYALPQ